MSAGTSHTSSEPTFDLLEVGPCFGDGSPWVYLDVDGTVLLLTIDQARAVGRQVQRAARDAQQLAAQLGQ